MYSFGLDFETGALTPTAVAGGSGQSMADSWGGATGYNCSFVTPLPATASKFYTQTFYCPNEAGYGRHIPGAVRAFRMQDHVCQTRGFKAVGDIGETGGEMPPHISVDRSGGFLLVANYGSGHVSSVRLERNASDKARAHGIVCADPVKGGKHEAARCPPASAVYVGGAPHSVYATPDNKCVLSPNINLDRVYAFNFDAKTGELTNASFVQSPKGTGPRHLAFVPADPQTVWVLNEPSTTLTGWKLATDGCGLTPFGANYSTLRPNDNRSEWHSAEIRARGKYLYVSNRFKCTSASQQCNGTIATFEIGGDGTLRLVGHVDSGGHCPPRLRPRPRGAVAGGGERRHRVRAVQRGQDPQRPRAAHRPGHGLARGHSVEHVGAGMGGATEQRQRRPNNRTRVPGRRRFPRRLGRGAGGRARNNHARLWYTLPSPFVHAQISAPPPPPPA